MLSQMSDTMMGLGQLTNEPRRILNKVLHTTRSMLLARTGAGQKPKGSATASSTQGRKTAKDMDCDKSKDKDSMDCNSHLSSSISLSASMSETEYACEFDCGCEDSTEDVKPQNEAGQQGDKAVSDADGDSQPMLLASLCGAEADKDIAMLFGVASIPIHAAAVDAALQRLVRPCDADLVGAPRDGCGDGLAFVRSAACPDIARYMEGIRRYKICGDGEYLMAMGLTLRALDALDTLDATNASSNALVFANADALRRLFLTSIAIACKYHHDNPFNSYSFGFLMGISARDMNALEAELLRILDFNATPSLPHLHSAVQLLSSPSLRPRSSSAN